MLSLAQIPLELATFKEKLQILTDKQEDILAKLEEISENIILRQSAIAKQLSTVIEQLTATQLTAKQSEFKFEACAKGFYQVRDAADCLLDRLDEAAGQITERTWLD